jgi:hypothetical protein
MILGCDYSQRNLMENETLNTFKNLLFYLLIVTGRLSFAFTT